MVGFLQRCNYLKEFIIVSGRLLQDYPKLTFSGNKPITARWFVINNLIYFLSHALIVTGNNQRYHNNSVHQTISVQQPMYPYQLGTPPHPIMSTFPYQSTHIHPRQFQGPLAQSDEYRACATWPYFGGTMANTVPRVDAMTAVTAAALAAGTPSLFPTQSQSLSANSLITVNCSSAHQDSLYVSSDSCPPTLQVIMHDDCV